jgi:hypothetical protein
MSQDFENDLFLLFNLAFDGLEKSDLKSVAGEADLKEAAAYIRTQTTDAPQVAVIQTRDKTYQRALLFRKKVKDSVVIFAFWKRGSICEGMAVSLDNVSPVNEFVWTQNAGTETYGVALRPKTGVSKLRQSQIKQAAVVSAVVDPLNKGAYRNIFGGDILRKLEDERVNVLENLKARGLVPTSAIDPAERVVESTPAPAGEGALQDSDMRTDFVAVRREDGAVVGSTQVTDNQGGMENQLLKELEKESRQAEREEERQHKLEQEHQEHKE